MVARIPAGSMGVYLFFLPARKKGQGGGSKGERGGGVSPVESPPVLPTRKPQEKPWWPVAHITHEKSCNAYTCGISQRFRHGISSPFRHTIFQE